MQTPIEVTEHCIWRERCQCPLRWAPYPSSPSPLLVWPPIQGSFRHPSPPHGSRALTREILESLAGASLRSEYHLAAKRPPGSSRPWAHFPKPVLGAGESGLRTQARLARSSGTSWTWLGVHRCEVVRPSKTLDSSPSIKARWCMTAFAAKRYAPTPCNAHHLRQLKFEH